MMAYLQKVIFGSLSSFLGGTKAWVRDKKISSPNPSPIPAFKPSTPWKINMEPTNHPFRKENDLNQTSMSMFQPLIFRGVSKPPLPLPLPLEPLPPVGPQIFNQRWICRTSSSLRRPWKKRQYHWNQPYLGGSFATGKTVGNSHVVVLSSWGSGETNSRLKGGSSEPAGLSPRKKT